MWKMQVRENKEMMRQNRENEFVCHSEGETSKMTVSDTERLLMGFFLGREQTWLSLTAE